VNVRKAQLEDVGAIAGVHVAVWQEAYQGKLPQSLLESMTREQREQGWHYTTQDPQQMCFVAEKDHKIIGFASAGLCRDEDKRNSHYAELMTLYVLAEFWGQGVGYALWQAALAELKLRAYRKVSLWVLKGNNRAIKFYKHVGFKADGQEKLESWGEHFIQECRYVQTLF
jgi:ribosomal protein S18 acetylase RimI-like enzyme